MKKLYTFLALLFLILFVKAQTPTALDSSFGTDGKVAFSAPMNGLPQVKAKHMLQPDGKIIICSNVLLGFMESEVMVSRFLPNGIIDSTFGINGTFQHGIIPGYNLAVGLELQPDGKIVTSGIFNDGLGTYKNISFILRLNNNGSLDSTFGQQGISTWEFSPEEERVTDMKRMADGSFILTGFISSTATTDSGFVAKVKPNGRLDSSFATNGLFRYQHLNRQTDLYSVEVMPDKSIIAGGSYSATNGFYQNLFIIKLDSTGSIYSSFANGGIFTKDLFSDYDEVHSLKRLQNGDILVAGYSYDDINTFNDGSFVMKLNAAGAGVSTFGINSVAYFSTPGAPNRSYDLDVQTNGKIVLAGYKYNMIDFNTDVMVLRFLANGTPDSSFNNGQAYIVTDFNNDYDESSSVLIQPDGKILVYGTAIMDPVTQDVYPVLARYLTGDAGGTLPLRLLNFSGVASYKNITLHWTTTNEKNTDFFIVERSNDGKDYRQVCKVYTNNTATQNNTYSYTDENEQNSRTFYRLRITDKDKRFTNSKVIAFAAKSKTDVFVYPSVTRSNFTLVSNTRENYFLYNSFGQVVQKIYSGLNDISKQAAGMYYIKTRTSVIAINKQ